MVYSIMAVSLAVLGLLISISVISASRTDERRVLDNEATISDISPSPDESENNKGRPAAAIPAGPGTSEPDSDKQTEGGDTVASAKKDDAAPKTTEPAPAAETLPSFIPVAIGPVSKGFSVDLPVYSLTMDDYRVHRGIDVSVPIGSDVFAAASGTISAVWEDPLSGCALRIEHAGGAVSTYYNLSQETIEVMRPGTSVKTGDVIGTVGDTSLLEIADEPHVHYELTIDGVYVDPCEYANYSAVSAVYGD